MALEPTFNVCFKNGCRTIEIYDTTGVYNDPYNTGGYGAPNATSASIDVFVIKAYLPKSTIPFIYSFTVVANVLTFVSMTKPDGTVVLAADMFEPYTGTVYPLPINDPFIMYPEDFDLSGSFGDGVMTFDFYVTNNPTTYLYDTDKLVSCAAECCIDNQMISLKANDCECATDKVMAAMKARAFLISAKASAKDGLFDEAQENIDMANQLCTEGCGC